MLTRVKIRLIVLFSVLSLFIIPSYLVLVSERFKRIAKAEEQRIFYANLAKEYSDYRKQHEELILKSREENIAKMSEVKAEYDSLLVQQPKIVAAHTKSVIDTGSTQVASNTSSNNAKSSKNSSTSVTVASKPKTTANTKAS